METKPTYFQRRYTHVCPAKNQSTVQIMSEICPDCGQKGAFAGFFQGIFIRIGRKNRLLGFPCCGKHYTYLPRLVRTCARCEGEGITRGDEFDFECPDCAGLGGFLIRKEEEMRKIRQWALKYHQRSIRERQKPERGKKKPMPTNPVLSRNIKSFAREVMAQFNYSNLYGERNHQIGEVALRCDDHGWEIFMEMVITWEKSGGGLGVGEDAIELRTSARKNALVLFLLHPPKGDQPQRMQIHRKVIRLKYGREKENKL